MIPPGEWDARAIVPESAVDVSLGLDLEGAAHADARRVRLWRGGPNSASCQVAATIERVRRALLAPPVATVPAYSASQFSVCR